MSIASITAVALTFRDRMRERWTPPWLSEGNNEKLMYAFALMADLLGDALAAGIASRYPGVYGYESLPVLGRERRIARGPYETDETYARRLRRWLNDHRRRGGAYALLSQLHAYYAPNNFLTELIYRSGRRYVMQPDGTVARDILPTFGLDARPEQWARWWLFFWTDDFDFDALTDADIADLRHVPREWNNGHCIGTLIVLEPGAELYNYPAGRTYNRAGLPYNNPARGRKIAVDHG